MCYTASGGVTASEGGFIVSFCYVVHVHKRKVLFACHTIKFVSCLFVRLVSSSSVS